MCRWAACIGSPIYLEEIVAAPGQALIDQSLHAEESKTPTNGDCFGLCWYGERDPPGLYHDVLPAWADDNLRHLKRVECSYPHPSFRKPSPYRGFSESV